MLFRRFRFFIFGYFIILGLFLAACGETPTPPLSPTAMPTNSPTAPTTANNPVATNVALPTAASITATPVSMASSTVSGGLLYTLMADNSLLILEAASGKTVASLRVSPNTPPQKNWRNPGHYMALSRDGKNLYTIVPGWRDEPDRLAVINTQTRQLEKTHVLPDSEGKNSGINPVSNVYYALAVGPQSGKVYLFGTRFASVIATVVDPASGAQLTNWTAKQRDGVEWMVYQAGFSADEKKLYLSYHNYNSSGIDVFELNDSGLQRCQGALTRYSGCLRAHGSFVLVGDEIIAASGDSEIFVPIIGGLAKGYDSGIKGHVREMAVNSAKTRLYTVGSCQATEGKAAGFAALDLTKSGIPGAVSPQGVTWQTPPGAPLVSLNSAQLCGERLVLLPDETVIVARPSAPPYPIETTTPGGLLYLNPTNGSALKMLDLGSTPLDLIFVP